MSTTYDYGNTDNEGQAYASDWHTWVQSQPWFQAALRQLGPKLQQPIQGGMQYGPGRAGSTNHAQAIREFQASVYEQSKKLGHLPPQDFTIEPSGDLTHNSFFERNPWVTPLLATAGFALGGVGLAAALGGGAAAGGAAGTGAALSDTVDGVSAAGAGGAAGSAGTTGAVVAGGGGTAAGLLGKLGTASAYAKDLAPVLGDAAKGAASADHAGDAQSLANAYFRLNAPAERLRTGIRASVAANAQPVHAEWGGPGSGLRGETLHYSGGLTPDAISPEAHKLADTTLHGALADAMAGDKDLPDPNSSSALSNTIGGSSLALSLLGALTRKRTQQPTAGA